MSRFHFEVMEEDIELGVQGDGSCCAVTRSIQRRFPHLSVYTDYDEITIGAQKVPTPTSVSAFARRLDCHLGVKALGGSPFGFDLDLDLDLLDMEVSPCLSV